MSSLTLSGVVLSLRITLALPVTVATLPIGSSGGSAVVAAGVDGSGAGGAGVGGGEGAGSVWACANCVRPGEAAAALVAPILALQANSMSGKDNWRCIGRIPGT